MSLSDKTKKRLRANCNVSLKGKTALVTGANSGVGFKTAETALFLGAEELIRFTEDAVKSAAQV